MNDLPVRRGDWVGEITMRGGGGGGGGGCIGDGITSGGSAWYLGRCPAKIRGLGGSGWSEGKTMNNLCFLPIFSGWEVSG